MSLLVDFSSRYNRLTGQKPDPALPLVEVLLINGKKRYLAIGLLDSGSVWSVIGTKYADALRLDYKNGREEKIFGLGGAATPGYEVEVKFVLRVAQYAWTSKVLVSTAADPHPFILLGHQGFFEVFDVMFQTRYSHFRMTKERPS